MHPYQERVIAEKIELDERIKKLNVFLESDVSRNLHYEDLKLLNRQVDSMQTYSDILTMRIRRFDLGDD